MLKWVELNSFLFSTYQNNAWVDFLETLLPRALNIAKQTDNEYRAGLPLDFLDYTGTSKSDVDSPNRRPFIKKVGLTHFNTLLLYWNERLIENPDGAGWLKGQFY